MTRRMTLPAALLAAALAAGPAAAQMSYGKAPRLNKEPDLPAGVGVEQKLGAIRAYRSQFDDERFERVKHFVTSTNGYHGFRCGFKFGELFALPHPVGAPDLVTLVHGSKPTTPPDVPVGQGHLPMG